MAVPWPRWLLSLPARPADDDSALRGTLVSALSAADSDPALLFSSIALLASLTSSPQHSAATSSYLTHNRLLPALGRLYQQQCALIVQRVQSLTERGQRRLLEEMWSEGGAHEWLLNDAANNAVLSLSDQQQLLVLSRVQTIIDTLIRCSRHAPRLKPSCDLCDNPALFTGLITAVGSLWQRLLTTLEQLPVTALTHRVRSLSLSALSLVYEATYKSKQQTRSGVAEVVGHISVMSQLLNPSSSVSASFYPLLQLVMEQLTRWLPESPLMCISVLASVAAAVLEIATAQRQKAEPPTDSQSIRQPTSQQQSASQQQRLDLSPLMRLLLSGASESVRVVTHSAATELVDAVDSFMQATLDAHTYFFRTTSQSAGTALPAFLLQTASSLVPLASSLLALTAAATGQRLSAVAVLALNLGQLIESCGQCHLLPQLLALVVQHGLIGWSWRAKERLQQLRGQHSAPARESDMQLKQLEGASRCFDSYLARLMAALEWWPQTAAGRHQRSEQWVIALDALFGGAQSSLGLIESLHLYASWRVAANIASSDQLSLVLTMSVALLLSQPRKKTTNEQDLGDEAEDLQQQAPSSQQLVLDSTKLINSIEQMLAHEKQRQSSSGSVTTTVLSRAVLLRLCLVLLLVERLHGRVASTRAKSALFSFLTTSGVTAAELVLSPPLQCCISDDSLGQWVWQQSTANQAAVLLHDQLLLTILSTSTEGCVASSRPPPFPSSSSSNMRTDRIRSHLSAAAHSLSAEEAAGPLQALVRRWRVAVQRWRFRQADDEDASTAESPRYRSEEVEQLLLPTCALMDSCAHKLATLNLLASVTQLLAHGYHRLLLPTQVDGDERLFPAVEVAAWLVHSLASLLSATSVPQHIPSSQLELMFDAACHLLLTFTTSDMESSTVLDSVHVARYCVQLLNAVLACAEATHHDTFSLLRVQLTSDERSCEALESLIRTGFSPRSWLEVDSAHNNNHRVLRVHMTRAADEGGEHLLQLCRLQLQVECMQLCTTLLVSSTDTGYALLDWEQTMAVLSHPCDEMKSAAFHYLVACFHCRVLRFKRRDEDELKCEEDESSESGWKPTEEDMTSAHFLLLAVQACLYPRQRLALSSAALDVMQAMLVSTTAAQQRELLDQPWHTFVVQSCLLALALPASVHSTVDERDRRVCQLYRYLHLLMGDDVGSDHSMPCRVAERYLKAIDSRLLQQLLFFPAIDDQPSHQSPAIVCRTSVYHYLTLIQHLHHSNLLPSIPATVTAQLPNHLRLIQSVLRATRMAAACPAAVAAAAAASEQEAVNELTSMECCGSAAMSSQLPSQSPLFSASQHSESACEVGGEADVRASPPFVVQCVCDSNVERGAESMVNKCNAEIEKLLSGTVLYE